MEENGCNSPYETDLFNKPWVVSKKPYYNVDITINKKSFSK